VNYTSTSTNGFFLAAVEAHSATAAGVVAALGDSIVAGGGSTGENTKWSDRLAVRLQGLSAPRKLSVLGLGIGGNRMLSGALGNPAALARFDSDVLGMAGLTHIILADGINDLGSSASNPSGPPSAEDVEYGLRQLVERAHARGVKVIGTTMGPAWGFLGYENIDFKRLAYNQWIRTVGVTILDGLIDFDAVLNDPANPSHMLPQYLTDGIHPNNAGHQAMADAINLSLFQ
jgi:lysophospholipase L1-like esterase